MKKMILPLLLAAVCAGLLGCATPVPMGMAYTDLKLPVLATDNGPAAKTGTATCNSYFGLVAIGDASIDAAKKNGGLTKVTHVDWQANNILGIIGTYTVTVYGE